MEELRPAASRVPISLVLLMLVSVTGGCYFERTSEEICECQFLGTESEIGMARTSVMPPHPDHADSWAGFLNDEMSDFAGTNIQESFGTPAWYKSAAGEVYGCFVIEGSDRINAIVTLESNHELLDVQILGVLFSRERSFWEKC
ncbi:MAG: hypothetical protein AAF680_00160 [Pseudomonadota bacterium]